MLGFLSCIGSPTETFLALLKRLMGQSIVYGIWAERNRKVLEGKTSIPTVIFK
ncbi:unnamed protein product [Brassica oleracea var. botrytis]|uniref:(rape) hypothetical protein n=1 Tax=Brassica napus TaxID=3708 RepID=A0A816KYK5_BRANA|nr:unnamed protein product [Brassica napus]